MIHDAPCRNPLGTTGSAVLPSAPAVPGAKPKRLLPFHGNPTPQGDLISGAHNFIPGATATGSFGATFPTAGSNPAGQLPG